MWGIYASFWRLLTKRKRWWRTTGNDALTVSQKDMGHQGTEIGIAERCDKK
jgi:hypothetical protein